MSAVYFTRAHKMLRTKVIPVVKILIKISLSSPVLTLISLISLKQLLSRAGLGG